MNKRKNLPSGLRIAILKKLLPLLVVLLLAFFATTVSGAERPELVFKSNIPANILINPSPPGFRLWQGFDVRQGEPKPEAIDRWLANCGGQGVRSPQLDEAPPGGSIGQVYIKMGRQYGINPAFAAAFFTMESSCGTNGSNLASHNFGNIRHTSGYNTLDGVWRAYPTWTDGMEDWFRLIRYTYMDERHLYISDQIVFVYAPIVENDSYGYAAKIRYFVTKIMQW